MLSKTWQASVLNEGRRLRNRYHITSIEAETKASQRSHYQRLRIYVSCSSQPRVMRVHACNDMTVRVFFGVVAPAGANTRPAQHHVVRCIQ